MLCTKGIIQSANFWDLSAWIRVLSNSCHFWNNKSILYSLKFYVLSTKGVYQSTNLVKFHVSSRKSEFLHFNGVLLLGIWLPVFARMVVSWIFFAGKSISELHVKMRKKSGGGVIIYIVLLNRGVPDVETIYFVSIEQKEKRIVYRNYQLC